MSDTSHDRSDHRAYRPDEVTDPLLWDLALEVADAHQPDAAGTDCGNLLCAGQGWPCAAWRTAQRALEVSRGTAAERQRAEIPEERRADPLTGWSVAPARGRRPTTPEQTRRSASAA
ncbi:hypothetical protein [Micromonospora sp. NPDC126480]|uniref:hypothetical protein n=1 Tax=Micromonospora sp. NPDC126480 TaxID=3155312 RepID=UPI00331D1DE3